MGKLKKQRNKTKRQKATPESRFNDALERLGRIERQHDRFREELDALVDRVSQKIKPYEIERLSTLRALSLHLIPFLSKKTLPEYLREELFDWIEGQLMHLNGNPFAQDIDYADIEAFLHQHLDKLKDLKTEKLFKQLEKAGHSDEEIAEAKDLFEKLRNGEDIDDFFEEDPDFGANNEFDGQDDLFGFDESLFGENEDAFEQAFDAFQDQQREQEQTLSRLLKATSINKLFRRIARAIHPDLAQDEEEKQTRHAQMSRLLHAREEKDIAYILRCYSETFGQLPEDFPKSDYDKLTTIINHKIQQLRDEKHSILMEKPFYAQFHDWFSASTPKQEARNIDRYVDNLRMECEGYNSIRNNITSIATLREHLEIRMYAFDDD